MPQEGFRQYVDKVVEYHQFQHELGLTDEEAKLHPDTFETFCQIVEIVSSFPEIAEAYQATLDDTSQNHDTALAEVRELEEEIASAKQDCEVISSRVYQATIRKLVKKAGIIAKAREFMSVFGQLLGSDPTQAEVEPQATSAGVFDGLVENGRRLDRFLFESSTEADSSDVLPLLTAHNFLALLALSLDRYWDGDTTVIGAIQKFASHTTVEFDEPATPEESFSRTATRVEAEISSFIEFNQPTTSLELLSEHDVEHINEIYNSNNLLALARDLTERSPDGLVTDEIDMLYRYKTILKRLLGHSEIIAMAQAEQAGLSKEPKDGARTWAGDIHPYGHRVGGVIDPAEFRAFSESEDPGRNVITVEGIPIKLRGVTHEPGQIE